MRDVVNGKRLDDVLERALLELLQPEFYRQVLWSAYAYGAPRALEKKGSTHYPRGGIRSLLMGAGDAPGLRVPNPSSTPDAIAGRGARP